MYTHTSHSSFGQALDAARDAGTKANALLALARAQLLGRELLKAVEAGNGWLGRGFSQKREP